MRAFQAALGSLETLNRRMIDRLLRTIDADLTKHIGKKFQGGGWPRLSVGTLALREAALAGHSSASDRLYYATHSSRLGSSFDPKGFGWTGNVEKLSLRPGEIRIGSQGSALTRTFDDGKPPSKNLLYWHFGTRQTITDKQRRFLRAAGLHLGKRKRVLRRPPRRIYDKSAPDRITARRTKQFEKALAAAFGDSLRGVKVVNLSLGS